MIHVLVLQAGKIPSVWGRFVTSGRHVMSCPLFLFLFPYSGMATLTAVRYAIPKKGCLMSRRGASALKAIAYVGLCKQSIAWLISLCHGRLGSSVGRRSDKTR